MTDYIRINLGITKVYLLRCDGGYLLIDTGYETDYKKFRKGLAKEKIRPDEIRYLLLTHHHDDHSGFAGRLKKEYGIPLIVQKGSIPFLADGRSEEDESGTYVTRRLRMLFSLFELFHREFIFPPVIIDEKDSVVDGDDDLLLRSIGLKAKILHTPGHTDDSMSVLFDDGAAFVGDAAMNFLKFTGTRYRPIYYTDGEKMYASIRRLLAAGAGKIMPAHGNPYSAKKLEKMLGSPGR